VGKKRKRGDRLRQKGIEERHLDWSDEPRYVRGMGRGAQVKIGGGKISKNSRSRNLGKKNNNPHSGRLNGLIGEVSKKQNYRVGIACSNPILRLPCKKERERCQPGKKKEIEQEKNPDGGRSDEADRLGTRTIAKREKDIGAKKRSDRLGWLVRVHTCTKKKPGREKLKRADGRA